MIIDEGLESWVGGLGGFGVPVRGGRLAVWSLRCLRVTELPSD